MSNGAKSAPLQLPCSAPLQHMIQLIQACQVQDSWISVLCSSQTATTTLWAASQLRQDENAGPEARKHRHERATPKSSTGPSRRQTPPHLQGNKGCGPAELGTSQYAQQRLLDNLQTTALGAFHAGPMFWTSESLNLKRAINNR